MVVCQFFLKGTCKFGDRCYNEHRKPGGGGGFNRQGYGDDNYNHGHRNQQNQRGHHTSHYGKGGSDGYRGGNDGYRGGNDGYRGGNDGYRGGNDGYRGGNDGYRGGNDGYRGGNDGYRGGNDGYRGGNDGYRGGNDGYRSGRNRYHFDSRNTGNNNRFSALSHQQDPEMPNFEQRSQSRHRDNSSSQQSTNPNQRLEKVKADIKECSEGGQWPFSCYAPSANDPCFDGLVDISPEEVRAEAYKANAEGSTQTYAQSLQQTMERYGNRKRELANMSSSSLQQELSRPSQPNDATSGLFGSMASLPSIGGNQTSLFGNAQPATTTSSTGLFGTSSQSSSGSGPFSSSPFPSSSKQVTLASTNPPGPFGSSSGTALSSQPLFGSAENEPNISGNGAEVQTTSLSMTSDSLPPVVPVLKCSEQDMKAFKADHFVLGAIPECPPPPELC